LLAQLTSTFDMFAPAIVPLPFAMVQVWPVGCVTTVTAYADPLNTVELKTNVPLALTVALLVLLFWSITPFPLNRPETVPPI
jgi:hypothetical protein